MLKAPAEKVFPFFDRMIAAGHAILTRPVTEYVHLIWRRQEYLEWWGICHEALGRGFSDPSYQRRFENVEKGGISFSTNFEDEYALWHQETLAVVEALAAIVADAKRAGG